jgi:hypothetical protein
MQNKWTRGRERNASALLNIKASRTEIQFQKKAQAARGVKTRQESTSTLTLDKLLVERSSRSGG